MSQEGEEKYLCYGKVETDVYGFVACRHPRLSVRKCVALYGGSRYDLYVAVFCRFAVAGWSSLEVLERDEE
jgi:hypothetical protein